MSHLRSGGRAPGRRVGALVAVALAMAATGCADAAAGSDPAAPATGPLTALSPCGDPPAASATAPAGAVLPDGAVVTAVTPQGPLVHVTATVPTTPVNIRLAYEARTDIDVLIVEDEVFEAELLVTDGTHRTYVKASAICQTGSTVLATVAPEDAGVADALPAPAGSAASGRAAGG